tara:strand:- start:2569 stop:3855 length:1287 start_codon:yes stop_codon:yes gene_type:complete
MYRPKVLVTAPVATRSGYGARSRDVVRALLATDKYDVKVFAVPWGATPQNALVYDDPKDKAIFDVIVRDQNEMKDQPDIHIHIVVPNEFQPVGKYNIGITAGLETTVIPQEWIEGCNRMDLVLASSKFSVEVMQQTVYRNDQGQELKIHKPMDVLFEGADTDIFHRKKSGDEYSKPLVEALDQVETNWNFLFVGHWLQGQIGHDRKDVGNLIRTFFTAFRGNKSTGLILKTSGASPCIMDREDMLKKIKEVKIQSGIDESQLPNVYLLHCDLFDDEVNDLYNHPKVKAHISFTHGEGFGRPLLEASLSGKPVIAPNWSGHVDFLNKNNSILLDGGLINVEKGSLQENIYIEGQQWYQVNYTAAAQKMLHVRKNLKTYKNRGMKQMMFNKSKFSFNSMVQRLDKLLDENLPKFTETVIPKINLPKLEKV